MVSFDAPKMNFDAPKVNFGLLQMNFDVQRVNFDVPMVSFDVLNINLLSFKSRRPKRKVPLREVTKQNHKHRGNNSRKSWPPVKFQYK